MMIATNEFLYRLIDLIFSFLSMALFIRVMLSWIPHNPYHPVVDFLYRVTDPLLRPFQNLIPMGSMGIDFSPILAFVALRVIKNLILQLLF